MSAPPVKKPSAGGRKERVVAVRLNEVEYAHLQVAKGSLTNSQYLRLLLKKAPG